MAGVGREVSATRERATTYPLYGTSRFRTSEGDGDSRPPLGRRTEIGCRNDHPPDCTEAPGCKRRGNRARTNENRVAAEASGGRFFGAAEHQDPGDPCD